MDGTATAPIKVAAFRSDTPERTGKDPMVVRWGFNGVVRDKYLEGNRAGFSGLPYGSFFPLARFTTPEEVHSTDTAMERERLVTKTAESVERYLGEVIGGKDAFGNQLENIANFGFEAGFYGELDVAKMAVISATLLPTLPQIRAIAGRLKMPQPISAKCEGTDTMDAGKTRETCPTCWAKWLDSPALDAYIAETSAIGREVDEFDPATGQSQTRMVAPTAEEFQVAREIAKNSIGTGLNALANIWAELATDLEEGGSKGITAYQHGIRKDLHESKPQDRRMNEIREFARQSGNNGGNAPAADNSEILMMLAKSQAQTNELLAKIAAGQQTGMKLAETSEIPTIIPTEAAPKSDLAPAAAKLKKAQEK